MFKNSIFHALVLGHFNGKHESIENFQPEVL